MTDHDDLLARADCHRPIHGSKFPGDTAVLVADLAAALRQIREENTRLACRVQDAWKRAENLEGGLEAMTKVARRLLNGWLPVDHDGAVPMAWYANRPPARDGEHAWPAAISDAERQALKRLGPTDG